MKSDVSINFKEIKFSTSQIPFDKVKKELVIVFLNPDERPQFLSHFSSDTRERIIAQFRVTEFNCDFRQKHYIYAPNGVSIETLLIIGTGSEEITFKQSKKLIAFLSQEIFSAKAKSCSIYIDSLLGRHSERICTIKIVQMIAKVFHTASYKYHESYLDATKDEVDSISISLHSQNKLSEASLAHGKALADGISITKQLVNLPANICTPSYISEKASALMSAIPNVKIEVLKEEELNEIGMGAFNAISKGSTHPGNITLVQYYGADTENEEAIILVGKGITFDTGGISLKPRFKMHEMKFDMGGAAAVLGTIYSIAKTNTKVNVVGVLANAENMPDANSCRPGDVVKSLSGKTIEIVDTDAEGRMVLCDAITYAIDRYNPKLIIDVATLTGSVSAALGDTFTGMFTNSDELGRAFTALGDEVNDPVWRLPLIPENKKKINSAFADISNFGGRNAGASIAACFLSLFVKDTPWAHLDIAGVVSKGGESKSATGRPVALLTEFIHQYHYQKFLRTPSEP